MFKVIHRIHEVLNMVKGFDNVGYSSDTVGDGYLMIDFEGKRYAVTLVEIPNPSEDPFKDMKDIRYKI